MLITKLIPIRQSEIPRFLCLATLILFINYVHNSLRMAKNALIISHLNVEAITAIKVWLEIPMALLFMLLYVKVSDRLSRTKIFYITVWFFLSYYLLFATVLYPHREALVIDLDHLKTSFPAMRYLFLVVSNWHYSLFYIFADLWSSMIFTVFFWQIVNNITAFEDSKRLYPLYGFMAEMGALLATYLSKTFIVRSVVWQQTLNSITASIIMAGTLLSLSLFILRRVVPGINSFNGDKKVTDFKNREKLSFIQSLRYVATSKYIIFITLLLLGYNISFTLAEEVWKKSIEVFFAEDANQIHYFMANVYTSVAVLTMVFALLGAYLIRLVKWKTTALISPVIVLIVGVVFFGLFVFYIVQPNASCFGFSTLTLVVYSGAIHNVFSRSTKYSLFDATKEAVYIPLDKELKSKGKAVAEIIGMRIGRGAGAFVQQALLMVFVNLTLLDLVPVVFVIFLMVMACWLFSTIVLGRMLEKAENRLGGA